MKNANSRTVDAAQNTMIFLSRINDAYERRGTVLTGSTSVFVSRTPVCLPVLGLGRGGRNTAMANNATIKEIAAWTRSEFRHPMLDTSRLMI